MTAERKPVVALFVDRSSQQWVVRDPERQVLGSSFG